jgi:hypothetical protein
MKKVRIILLFILLPLACSAQFLGVGVQYADAKGKGMTSSLQPMPLIRYGIKKNPFNSFISSGIDYTGGSSPVAGLNLKPIQLTSFISESLFNKNKVTVLVGCDAGYLFNFRHGKDGIVITPNVYIDYKFFFAKAGYDFNVTGNEQQFFVRAGFCFGMGSIKSFVKTEIW